MSRKRARSTGKSNSRAWRRDLVVISVAAFVLSVAAETMTAAMYIPAEPKLPAAVRHVAAALLQMIVILLIHGRGWMVFHRPDWFVLQSGMMWAYVLTAALLMAAVIEFMAVRSRIWSCTALTPVIPVARIGIVPLLQMPAIAAAVFLLVARLRKRRSR